MSDKMREEFEAKYVEGLVARCGEGFRSTALYSLSEKRPDGEYQHYPDFIAWWAWKASRESLAIELPNPLKDLDISDRHIIGMGAQFRKDKEAIEAAGLKVKP